MSITSVNGTSVPNALPASTSQKDSYEKSIMKQIADTQEKLRSISENGQMSMEQKMNKRKELKEQIQNLNSELRQHQAQKRREEAAKLQEAVKQADSSSGGKRESDKAGLNTGDMGVIVSLSTAKEQIAGMEKIKTDLEGKLRTASSQEEQEKWRQKVEDITKRLTEKAKEANDTISEHLENEKGIPGKMKKEELEANEESRVEGEILSSESEKKED